MSEPHDGESEDGPGLLESPAHTSPGFQRIRLNVTGDAKPELE
jgi:hypothetical protein